jgi:hypothetical protein
MRRQTRIAALAGALVGLLGSVPAVAAAPKKDKQPNVQKQTIKLEEIGAPALSDRMLSVGASMMSVNVLDDTHLLVTHASRKLITRLKDDPADDDDRMVEAKVVELPTGRVVATTDWHLHDHARYLWSIGKGRFVLRIGNELSVLAPLANLGSPDPFLRIALPHQHGMPLAAVGSPDGGIFSVITQVPVAAQSGPKVVMGDNTDNLPKPTYAVDFFRVEGEGTTAAPLQMVGAGALHVDAPIVLPMDADGYLWADDGNRGNGHWMVTFNDFNGGVVPVGAVDSNCAPRLRMASRSEFLAITCRLQGLPTLRSFGLDGHETWEEDFGEFAETPAFAYAPAAGRFAMSREWTSTSPQSGADPGVSTTNEEMRVYATESGDLLLKVEAAPLFHTPENFDLSEDGQVFVVVNGRGIEVYTLPPPGKRDLEDLAEVSKFAPPASDAPVRLAQLLSPHPGTALPAAVATQQEALSAPVSTTTAEARPSSGKAAEAVMEGDSQPTGVRQRPTLLNPGEKPEFKDKTAPSP